MSGYEELERIADGFMPSRVLICALELDLFRRLGARTLPAAELARRTKADAGALRRLLDALVALGVLRGGGAAGYRNTPAARRCLAGGEAERDALLHRASMWERWGELGAAVVTGRARPKRRSRARERLFTRAMAALGSRVAAEVAAKLVRRVPTARRILDVGGGPGVYAIAFAKALPGARITVLDRPGPLAEARRRARAAGLAARIRPLARDALTGRRYGSGYDLVFTSNFLHCHPEEEIPRIIERCTRALAAHGVLAIKDFFRPGEGVPPLADALFSLQMLVSGGGDLLDLERTRASLRAAGVVARGRFRVGGRSEILWGRRA